MGAEGHDLMVNLPEGSYAPLNCSGLEYAPISSTEGLTACFENLRSELRDLGVDGVWELASRIQNVGLELEVEGLEGLLWLFLGQELMGSKEGC